HRTEPDATPACTAAATQTSPRMAVPTTQGVSERRAAKRVGPATRNGAQAERAERSRLEAEPGPEVELDPEVFGRKLQISIAFAFKHETPNAPQANCERGPDKGPSPRLPAHHPPEQDRKDNA